MKELLDKIIIDPEIRDFLTAQSQESFLQLEENLLNEGCRDNLVCWAHQRKLILIDGFNRYEICKKHNIPFEITKKRFQTKEEVFDWMLEQQIGRRNLSSLQLSYYRGLKYERNKKSHGGAREATPSGQFVHLKTDKVVGEQFNVSDKTIRRDAKFSIGIDKIGEKNPQLKKDILSGKIKTKKSDIQKLSEINDFPKVISQEELNNIISNLILTEVPSTEEKSIELINPLFLPNEHKIVQLKGAIISSINSYIEKKNNESFEDIYKNLDKLRKIVFRMKKTKI